MSTEMNFDALDWNPQTDQADTGFTPIPEGVYRIAVETAECKPTKAGDGEYLSLTFQVLDGQHKGRKLFDKWNYRNKSTAAVAIAKATCAAFHKSAGLERMLKTHEFAGKSVTAKVVIETNGELKQNKVKQYLFGEALSKAMAKLAAGGEEAPF